MSVNHKYVLFDGVYHQKLKPLTLTRPVSDLRIGIFKIKDKWELALDNEVSIRTKDYLSSKFKSNLMSVKLVSVVHYYPIHNYVMQLILWKKILL